jgi:hypothetical protein
MIRRYYEDLDSSCRRLGELGYPRPNTNGTIGFDIRDGGDDDAATTNFIGNRCSGDDSRRVFD